MYEGDGNLELNKYCQDASPFDFALDWHCTKPPPGKGSSSEQKYFVASHFDKVSHTDSSFARGLSCTYAVACCSSMFVVSELCEEALLKAHWEQTPVFISDITALLKPASAEASDGVECSASPQSWLHIALEYGVKSLLYIPLESSVLELGSTQVLHLNAASSVQNFADCLRSDCIADWKHHLMSRPVATFAL